MALSALWLLSFNAWADHFPGERHKNEFELPHIKMVPDIDGHVDEAIWQQALQIDLEYETRPAENTPPAVKTESFLYEDGETLYLAFKAYDDPKNIRAYLSDRDQVWSSDIVGVKFDTFGESKRAFQFFVNPLGVQADSIQEDFRGDDESWNEIWNAKGQITEFGYSVEMAIPFKALRFPDNVSKQSWGFELLRFLPRGNHHRIANTPVNRDVSCRICQFDRLVGLQEIKPSQNLQLVPTLVVGKSDTRSDPANQPWRKGDIETEAGLDFRWGVTQDIVLNTTLNPDFSQVEADDAQLDINNTFSIFVPERRPFFVEGADYFTTSNRLLHTRDIIAPDYGAKVTGQSNGHSFGVFIANDNHTSFLLPGSQSSELVLLENVASDNQVLRYSYDLGDKNTLGALLTHKTADGYSNQVVSLDGKFWFDQNHSIAVQYMDSDSEYSVRMMDDYDNIEQSRIGGQAYSVNFRHDSRSWWGYLNYEDFGKDFRADLGFISRVDFSKRVVGLGYRWYSDQADSFWSMLSLGGDWDFTEDESGQKLEEETEVNLMVEGIMQSFSFIGVGKRSKFYDQQFFDEQYVVLETNFQPLEGLGIGLELESADSIDYSNSQLGRLKRISPWIDWQLSAHWKVRWEHNQVNFDVGSDDLFDAVITNMRLTYQIDSLSFGRFTLQQFDVEKNQAQYTDLVDAEYEELGIQFLYSYKINPQTLFFAGYSDAGFRDDSLNRIEKTGKNLFMKFSYAWQV